MYSFMNIKITKYIIKTIYGGNRQMTQLLINNI